MRTTNLQISRLSLELSWETGASTDGGGGDKLIRYIEAQTGASTVKGGVELEVLFSGGGAPHDGLEHAGVTVEDGCLGRGP